MPDIGEIDLGQDYVDGKEAYQAIRHYALQCNKSVKLANNGGSSKRVVCTSEGCSFYIQLVKMQKQITARPWYISSAELNHLNCTSQAKPRAKELASLSTVLSAVGANSKIEAKSLRQQVQDVHAIDTSTNMRTLYRARTLAREKFLGDFNLNYSKIPGFLEKFVDLNQGSIGKVERHSDGRFKRACVVPQVLAASSWGNQRIVGIDGGHSKCTQYHGLQMLFVGRDGNFKNVIIGVALVDSETKENYIWFLECLISAGVTLDTPIFCDRSPGFAAASDELQLDQMYCTKHIIRNISENCHSFNESQGSIIYEIQASVTEEVYKSKLAILGLKYGVNVEDYVKSIPPQKWCVWPHLLTKALYGWRSTNFVETEMGASKKNGIRGLPPFMFMDAVVKDMLTDQHRRSVDAKKWKSQGLKITPAALQIYNDQHKLSGTYSAYPADNNVIYIENNMGFPRIRRRVNLQERTCTCMFMAQFRIPCRHYCCALQNLGRMVEIWDHFGSEYQVEQYCYLYEDHPIFIPVEGEYELDMEMLPAVIEAPKRGRPKSRRFRSRGESGPGSYYRRRALNIAAAESP